MNTSESWGVNMHTMRWTSAVSVVSQLRLRANETEISAALRAHEVREGLYYLHLRSTDGIPRMLYYNIPSQRKYIR